MKNYKKYIIGAGILIMGIIIGNIFSGNSSDTSHKEDEHNYVQDSETKIWTCSMHPQIKLKKPGSCPICGMDLISLDNSNTGENIGTDEIVMTQEAIQLANIQTTIVGKSNEKKEIRLLGRVKPDERRLFSQVSHIPGRIERLYVNFTGEKVSRGQKIVRIYSPDLISAQKELFISIQSKDVYPQLYEATRNKLKLWKLSDAQIDAIISSGKVQEEMDILSDYSGYVMQRNVELGDHVMEGMKLFDIANLDKVWIMFEVYESDLSWIHINDEIKFTMPAIPGKSFQGKITYIDPFVSATTRVAKVRVELKNPSHKLLPEMYVNGIIKAKLNNNKDAIVIPKSAVLWTGKRSVVYVKVPHKNIISFVYREIILGGDLGDFYIIENGLEVGEEIATNGVFRIDASAQLMGQKSMMNPDGGEVNTGGHAGMDMGDDPKKTETKKTGKEDMSNMIMIDKSKTDPKFKVQLGNVVDAYITLKDALTKDDATAAQKQTNHIKSAIEKVDMLLLLGDAHNVWMKALKAINKNISKIQANSNIEEQRKAFGLLSKDLSDVINMLGVKMPNNKAVYLEFCAMADNNKGSYWLSYDKKISNPFYGQGMLTCGEVKKTYE